MILTFIIPMCAFLNDSISEWRSGSHFCKYTTYTTFSLWQKKTCNVWAYLDAFCSESLLTLLDWNQIDQKLARCVEFISIWIRIDLYILANGWWWMRNVNQSHNKLGTASFALLQQYYRLLCTTLLVCLDTEHPACVNVFDGLHARKQYWIIFVPRVILFLRLSAASGVKEYIIMGASKESAFSRYRFCASINSLFIFNLK